MAQLGKRVLQAAAGAVLLGALSGCITNKTHLETFPPGSGLEFPEASIILEHNATDGDAEIVVFVKGGDEGLAKLRVYAPDGTAVLDLSTQDRTVGLREFTVESAEPGVAKVISAYPEGIYRIEGVTLGGARLHASASLSHQLPSRPELEVSKTEKTVTWSSVAGAVGYRIELEREVDGEDVMKLTIDLPATAGSFSIPRTFQVPGDYQVGVAVHGANGNITVVEVEFSLEQ